MDKLLINILDISSHEFVDEKLVNFVIFLFLSITGQWINFQDKKEFILSLPGEIINFLFLLYFRFVGICVCIPFNACILFDV